MDPVLVMFVAIVCVWHANKQMLSYNSVYGNKVFSFFS